MTSEEQEKTNSKICLEVARYLIGIEFHHHQALHHHQAMGFLLEAITHHKAGNHELAKLSEDKVKKFSTLSKKG